MKLFPTLNKTAARTTADILAGFTSMITELQAIATREEAEAERIASEMNTLARAQSAALDEAAKAKAAAEKIGALVA